MVLFRGTVTEGRVFLAVANVSRVRVLLCLATVFEVRVHRFVAALPENGVLVIVCIVLKVTTLFSLGRVLEVLVLSNVFAIDCTKLPMHPRSCHAL